MEGREPGRVVRRPDLYVALMMLRVALAVAAAGNLYKAVESHSARGYAVALGAGLISLILTPPGWWSR